MRLLFIAFLTLCFSACQTVQHSKVDPVHPDWALMDEETRELFEKAEAGVTDAQNRLAIRYLQGEGGLPVDPAKAVTWFERSSEGGNRWAMSNLAKMYREGDGVEQDIAKAIDLFRQSAEAGNHQAMAHLAEFHASGDTGKIDFQLASFWYSRALLGPFDPWIANNAAWFFSTVEDETFTKPELAVNLMLRVVSVRELYYELDTLAAAYAAQGDFDSAIIAQQRALVMGYENEAGEAEMNDFENRLGTYFDRQRYIFYKRDAE